MTRRQRRAMPKLGDVVFTIFPDPGPRPGLPAGAIRRAGGFSVHVHGDPELIVVYEDSTFSFDGGNAAAFAAGNL